MYTFLFLMIFSYTFFTCYCCNHFLKIPVSHCRDQRMVHTLLFYYLLPMNKTSLCTLTTLLILFQISLSFFISEYVSIQFIEDMKYSIIPSSKLQRDSEGIHAPYNTHNVVYPCKIQSKSSAGKLSMQHNA